MSKKNMLVVKLLFSSLLIAYILITIPVYNIFNAIESADILFILIALLLSIPVIIFSSFQTKILIKVQKISISLKEIIKIYLTTSFYSTFLPGSLSGGVVKWYKFAKFGSKSSAAAIVIFNRFLEMLVVLILGILYSIPILLENRLKVFILIFPIILFLLTAGYIILLNKKVFEILTRLIKKLPLNLFIKEKIIRLLNAVNQFKNLSLRYYLVIFGVMFAYHLINLISFYLLALSLNLSVSIWVFGWIGSVVTIFSIVPVFFLGLGIREGIFIYLLGFYGVEPHVAVALSFLTFFKLLFISFSGGLLELKDFLFRKGRAYPAKGLNSIKELNT